MVGGNAFRLPTEAEWEYACRAGTTGDRYGNIDVIAWYYSNSGSTTHPVGQKQANAWGLFDTLGNVWEWCQDWYGDYSAGYQTDPTGPGSGSYRVDRGGSWCDDARLRALCRSRRRASRLSRPHPRFPPGEDKLITFCFFTLQLMVDPPSSQVKVEELIFQAFLAVELLPPRNRYGQAVILEKWRLSFKIVTLSGKMILIKQ